MTKLLELAVAEISQLPDEGQDEIARLLLRHPALADNLPPELERQRREGSGPWAPEVLAEDERRLAAYLQQGEAIAWADAKAWMESWFGPGELPPPEPRRL